MWVECARAASDGHEFYISKNGVLLCGDLLSKYVSHVCDYSYRSALPLPRVARLDYPAEKEPEAGYMTVHSDVLWPMHCRRKSDEKALCTLGTSLQNPPADSKDGCLLQYFRGRKSCFVCSSVGSTFGLFWATYVLVSKWRFICMIV